MVLNVTVRWGRGTGRVCEDEDMFDFCGRRGAVSVAEDAIVIGC